MLSIRKGMVFSSNELSVDCIQWNLYLYYEFRVSIVKLPCSTTRWTIVANLTTCIWSGFPWLNKRKLTSKSDKTTSELLNQSSYIIAIITISNSNKFLRNCFSWVASTCKILLLLNFPKPWYYDDLACSHTVTNNLPITTTVMVALSLPIGLVTVHVYVPLSLVVTLLMT